MTTEFYTFRIRITPFSRSRNHIRNLTSIKQRDNIVLVIFVNFINADYRQPGITDCSCVTVRTVKTKSQIIEFLSKGRELRQIHSLHAEQNAIWNINPSFTCITMLLAFFRSNHLDASTAHTFKQSLFSCSSNSQNFSSRLHFRPQSSIHIHKLFKTKNRNFHSKIRRRPVKTSSKSHILNFFTHHSTCSKFNHRNTSHFADIRDSPTRTWICLDNVKFILINQILNIHKPFRSKTQSQVMRLLYNLFPHLFANAPVRIHRNRIPRMNTSSFHMLHNARNQNILAITNSVHLQLNSFHIFINQNRILNLLPQNNRHIFFYVRRRVCNNHILPAQNITWTQQNRIFQTGSRFKGLNFRKNSNTFWTLNIKPVTKFFKTFTVLSQINRISRSTKNPNALFIKKFRQINRSLTTKSHHNTNRIFRADNIHHVHWRQRFKIKPVRRIKISRNSFRVIINNSNLVPKLFQRPHTLHRRIIKLNSLPNANRSRTKNNNRPF